MNEQNNLGKLPRTDILTSKMPLSNADTQGLWAVTEIHTTP